MTAYEGGCACSAIKYEFIDEPMNSAFCYCKNCQLHTGSDKWFGLWVAKSKFTYTQGTPSKFTRQGNSGKEVYHHFCPHCGTTLCVEVMVADIYSVAASTVDGNEQFSPNLLIYAASAPRWAVFPEGVPKFDTLPPDL